MPKLNQAAVDALAKFAKKYIREHNPGYKLRKKPLGVGATAAVFEMSLKTEKKPIKIFIPEIFEGDEAAAQHKRTELQRKLIGHNCHSLVQIESIEPYNGSCVCIMEYLPWDELRDRLKNI